MAHVEVQMVQFKGEVFLDEYRLFKTVLPSIFLCGMLVIATLTGLCQL